MNLFALSSTQQAGGQIALAALLGVVGFFLLLPRPRGRFVPGGIAALVGAVAVFAAWAVSTFGRPLPDVIGTALFYLFAGGALVFGTALVVQRNPARGAIAFAFVILSTCGLFLLLAAPFLMAATVIIYAGAIVVTFLFVLMLSQAGVSDENDRTREPLLGSFAGFAFVGLVLFALHQTGFAAADAPDGPPAPARLLSPVITAAERQQLADAAARLDEAEKVFDGDVSTATARNGRVEEFQRAYGPINDLLAKVVGGAVIGADAGAPDLTFPEQTGRLVNGSMRERLELAPGGPAGQGAVLAREDQQARDVLKRAAAVRKASGTLFGEVERVMLAAPPATADERDRDPERDPQREAAKAAVRKLRDEVVLLRGAGDLPAANVRNLGLALYSGYLLMVELAGALLLVAVIGAVAITQRKRVGAPGDPAGGPPARTEVAK